jgi:FKBP-type peptidyl-prolyl cis-trans isomerase FkpA
MIRSSALLTLVCAMAVPLAHAADAPPAAVTATAAAVSSVSTGPVADKLIMTDTKVGTGKEAMVGAQVRVNYTGWLYRPLAKDFHGKQFDSSIGRAPFDFRLGAGMVIKGWDNGVAGMKVGGKRTLIIPSDMAYGSRSPSGDIPPNSALIFDVELLDVK